MGGGVEGITLLLALAVTCDLASLVETSTSRLLECSFVRLSAVGGMGGGVGGITLLLALTVGCDFVSLVPLSRSRLLESSFVRLSGVGGGGGGASGVAIFQAALSIISLTCSTLVREPSLSPGRPGVRPCGPGRSGFARLSLV